MLNCYNSYMVINNNKQIFFLHFMLILFLFLNLRFGSQSLQMANCIKYHNCRVRLGSELIFLQELQGRYPCYSWRHGPVTVCWSGSVPWTRFRFPSEISFVILKYSRYFIFTLYSIFKNHKGRYLTSLDRNLSLFGDISK